MKNRIPKLTAVCLSLFVAAAVQSSFLHGEDKIFGRDPLEGLEASDLDQIHVAAAAGDMSYFEAADFGAINKMTKNGATALMIAAARGHNSFVESLIQKGADSKLVDKNGWTALHFVISNAKKAEDVNWRKEYSFASTTLISVSHLLAKDINGITPIHLSATTCKADWTCLTKLRESKVALNITDNSGRTPLHFLAMYNMEPTVAILARYMLTFGSDIATNDNFGKTPLDYAKEYGNNAFYDEFYEFSTLNKPTESTNLEEAIIRHDSYGLKYFSSIAIESSFIKHKDKLRGRCSPITAAIIYDNLEAAKHFIDTLKWNSVWCERAEYNRNALQILVAKNGSIEFADFLISRFPALLTDSKYDLIPLLIAEKRGAHDLAEFLRKKMDEFGMAHK